MKYSHILSAFSSAPWAIQREKLQVIKALLELRASGIELSQAEKETVQAGPRPSPRTQGSVAVIPVYGVISHRMNMLTQYSGGTSTDALTKTFRQALSDPGVKAIVFDIDSPGGSVDGVAELADEIFKARGQKKMVAVCNTLMASAAYWLGSSADEVVCTPSGEMGSIGVYMVHEDDSASNEANGIKVTYISAGKYKTEGNPDEPLSDEAKQALQDKVDAFYSMFVNAVSRNRGVSTGDVRNGFGQGRTELAKDAVKLGMADKVATLDQTLARFGAGGQVTQMSAEDENLRSVASSAPSTIQATDVQAAAKAADGEDCECSCESCESEDCANCKNEKCEDMDCKKCPNQTEADNADTDAIAQAPAAQATEVPENQKLAARRRREMDFLELS